MPAFVNKLIFNCDETECFIGSRTNPGKGPATGITDKKFGGSVVIPSFHQGKPIHYIGYYAFFECSEITEVHIEARVKALYQYAFGHMPKLWKINVPSTCTFLGTASIYSYNCTNPQNYDAAGTIVIQFEPNSKLETIDKYAFGRKERIVLIMCERIRTLNNVHEPFYVYTKYFEIYSPFSFSIGSSITRVMKYIGCNRITCDNIRRKRYLINAIFYVIMFLS